MWPEACGAEGRASEGHRGPMAWLATACGGAGRDMDPIGATPHWRRRRRRQQVIK